MEDAQQILRPDQAPARRGRGLLDAQPPGPGPGDPRRPGRLGDHAVRGQPADRRGPPGPRPISRRPEAAGGRRRPPARRRRRGHRPGLVLQADPPPGPGHRRPGPGPPRRTRRRPCSATTCPATGAWPATPPSRSTTWPPPSTSTPTSAPGSPTSPTSTPSGATPTSSASPSGPPRWPESGPAPAIGLWARSTGIFIGFGPMVGG